MSTDSKALVAALKLLGRRDHFCAELEERLRTKGFSPEAAGSARRRCEEMGYLGDEQLARRFARTRAPERGWGPARIRMELRRRGIKGPLLDDAVNFPDEILRAALETGLRRAENRAREGWWRGREGRARMVSSLLRRGFESEVARRAVDRLAIEREAEECEP